MDTFLTQLRAVVSAILTFQSIQTNQKLFRGTSFTLFPMERKNYQKNKWRIQGNVYMGIVVLLTDLD